MTRRARPSIAAKTYRITDPGGPNIDPVSQMGGRYVMRLHPRGDPAERRAARLTVCANATGPDDAIELLQTLGLDQPDQEPTP